MFCICRYWVFTWGGRIADTNLYSIHREGISKTAHTSIVFVSTLKEPVLILFRFFFFKPKILVSKESLGCSHNSSWILRPLKETCKDFENLVNVYWIGTFSQEDLLCKRNFDNFLYFLSIPFYFSIQIFLWNDSEKRKPQWQCRKHLGKALKVKGYSLVCKNTFIMFTNRNFNRHTYFLIFLLHFIHFFWIFSSYFSYLNT